MADTDSAARPVASVYLGTAALIWCATFVVLLSMRLDGRLQAYAYEVYLAAGQHWLDGKPLYELDAIYGFLYFPQAAMLMAAFVWLDPVPGEILWRLIWWSLYALGVLRFSRKLVPDRTELCFLLATCLAVGPAVGPLGNGQANLASAALILHVMADVADKRFWRAAVLATLGLAVKPVMLVIILLVAALHRTLMWRLAITIAVLFVSPWLFKEHAYVVGQYGDCVAKLSMSGRPEKLHEDLRGLLASLGWLISHEAYLVLRLLAAVGTLAVCWRAQRRIREPHAGLFIAGLGVGYLMLFNPRTLSTSYAMSAPVAALLAGRYLLERRTLAGAVMVTISVAWAANHNSLPLIEHWLKPLAAVFFAALLLDETLSRRGPALD